MISPVTSSRGPQALFAALAAPFFLASSGTEGVAVQFHATEGKVLSKTVQVTHELALDETGTTQDGSPLIREDIGGWLTAGTRLAVDDEYVSVGDGRPLVLRRTLRAVDGTGKISLSGDRGEIEYKASTLSPLAGQVILYTWIEDEGDYARMYDRIHGAERDLLELSGDMDLLALLPSGEVQEGDSWPIDLAGLRDVLAAGGNMKSVPQDDGFFSRMYEVGVGGDLADVLGRELQGSARATLRGVRETEGTRLATIGVELAISSERDRTRAYIVGMPDEEKHEASLLQQVRLTWSFDGEGQLLWDLEQGHARSLRIEGHEVVSAEIFKMSAEESSEPALITQRTTYGGQLRYSMSFRPPRARTDDGDGAEEKGAEGRKKKKKKKDR